MTLPLETRFAVGDAVEVLDLGIPGHVRTPHYVRSRRGRIVSFVGYFLNPESLSVGDTSGPLVPLYRVGFRMRDLWPGFDRNDADLLCLEIYDHWLSPVDAAASTSAPHEASHA